MLPLLLLVYAIGAGSRAIAGEEESGTLDLLLAHPLSRRRLLAEKLGAMAVEVGVIAAATAAVVVVAAQLVSMDVSVGRIVAGVLAITLLALAHGGVALLVGAATGGGGCRDRRRYRRRRGVPLPVDWETWSARWRGGARSRPSPTRPARSGAVSAWATPCCSRRSRSERPRSRGRSSSVATSRPSERFGYSGAGRREAFAPRLVAAREVARPGAGQEEDRQTGEDDQRKRHRLGVLGPEALDRLAEHAGLLGRRLRLRLAARPRGRLLGRRRRAGRRCRRALVGRLVLRGDGQRERPLDVLSRSSTRPRRAGGCRLPATADRVRVRSIRPSYQPPTRVLPAGRRRRCSRRVAKAPTRARAATSTTVAVRRFTRGDGVRDCGESPDGGELPVIGKAFVSLRDGMRPDPTGR